MNFVSEVEKLAPTEELNFEPTPGFGNYRHFLGHAISHPAKANTLLLTFLVKKFTKEGETVLDPMAGTGSTGVVASLHGRNAIQVELEKKFFDWMEEARRKVERHSTLTPKGKIVNIHGDARCLSKLLGQVDVAITSPPYADTDPMADKEWFLKHRFEFRGGGITGEYSPSTENIGNLPFVDTVITSPPYEHQLHDSSERRVSGSWAKGVLDVEKNLPLGYSENPENIGNLRSSEEEYKALEKGLMRGGKPTYLSEMFRVYREMWRVLKPGGLAIIIVKPFVRRGKVVDLPYHTWLLMSKVGFRLERVYKLRLEQSSFWRILYHKKHPEIPQIHHEWILVTRKSDSNPFK